MSLAQAEPANGGRETHDAGERRVRKLAAIAALGGLVILVSFLLLPWETYSSGSSYEAKNSGHEVRVYNDDGDPVQGYLFAFTLFAAGLALIPFLISLALPRRAFAICIAAAAVSVAWVVFSVAFFGKYEIDSGYGLWIAWVGGGLAAAGAVMAGLASRRLRTAEQGDR